MKIEIVRAMVEDAPELHRVQVAAFTELYARYRDMANPAIRTVEEVAARFKEQETDHWAIKLERKIIGFARVERRAKNICYLASMCIEPDYQCRGYAIPVLRSVEKQYPKTNKWTLQTIKQEAKLCYLYENLGYRATGIEKELQPGMTLASYEKAYDKRIDLSEKQLRKLMLSHYPMKLLFWMILGAAGLTVIFSASESLKYSLGAITALLVAVEAFWIWIVLRCRTRTVCGVINSANAVGTGGRYIRGVYYKLTIGSSNQELRVSEVQWKDKRIDRLIGKEVTLLVEGNDNVLLIFEN